MKAPYKGRTPSPRYIRDKRSILSNILPLHEVYHMALSISERLGIPIEKANLTHKFKNPKLLPAVYSGKEYTIWIDHYYIAIEWNEDGKIHFVYLTRRHVYEEWRDLMQARELKRPVALDRSIRKQYITAWNKMIACEKGYALRELKPLTKSNPPLHFGRWK